jgi:Fe-S-cluster containining protein
MSDPADPVDPAATPESVFEAVAAALERIAAGSFEGAAEVARLRAQMDLLVDILVSRGALTDRHRRLIARATRDAGASAPRVRLQVYTDKYKVPDNGIDCASLLHLCGGRCCSFHFILGPQDLAEGKVRWDLERPYVIQQEKDRYCTHYDRPAGGGCTIYAHRPAPCRQYDCRQDERVWIDYEQRIPAPMEEGVTPPRSC